MSNQEKLYNVFSSLFGVPKEEVTDALSPDAVPKWDSLGTVNLVVELEREFNVRFDLMDVMGFLNVGIVKTALAEKGVSFD